MLQSVLQAVFRLGRRDVDNDPDVHVHLHLHAGERLVLRLLPPVRLRLVQQCGRDVQLEPEFRLRLPPVLGLRDKPAQGRKPLRPGRI